MPNIKNKNLISFVETPSEIAELMVKLITKQKSCGVLDTGCGKGIFLKYLVENGFTNIAGIELNRANYDYCKSSYSDVSLFNNDFLMWNPAKKYDLIAPLWSNK